MNHNMLSNAVPILSREEALYTMDDENDSRRRRRAALYPVVRTDEVKSLGHVTQSLTSGAEASMKRDEQVFSVRYDDKSDQEPPSLSSSMMESLSSHDIDVNSIFQSGDFFLEQKRILDELAGNTSSQLSSHLPSPQEGDTSAAELGNGQSPSLEVVQENDITDQPGTSHGNNTINDSTEGSFDIQNALNDQELIREQMRLLQELQKERHSAAKPCPSSKHTIAPLSAAQDDSLAPYEHDSLVYLSNGSTVHLQGTSQVYHAVENGTSVKVQCYQCKSLYLVAKVAQALYCMECHQVSSMALAVETIRDHRKERRKLIVNRNWKLRVHK